MFRLLGFVQASITDRRWSPMFDGGEGGVHVRSSRPPARGQALIRRAGALLRREGFRVVAAIVLFGISLELLGALAGFGTPVFLAAEAAVAVALLLIL
jgi:hypothetical protein